jgi:uncharacterized protein YjeT (DUF2065 family)
MTDLFSAFALVLVLEGILPFAWPGVWRRAMTQAAEMDDSQLRIAGAVCILAGLLFLYLIR